MRDVGQMFASALGAVLFVAAVLGATYLYGRAHGRDAERDTWIERQAEIDRQVAEMRKEQGLRLVRLVERIDELRSRPERIRTVTREVVKHVVADAECSSVPESLRVLWSADRAPGDPAGTAGLGDAGMRAVAAAGR